MSEIESKLQDMLKSVQDMTNILKKSKEIHEDVPMTCFYKKIEDGILDNIEKANEYQMNVMMNNYTFRYYTEFNRDKNLLKRVITEKIRGSKLDELLKRDIND